jgi:acetylornithine deacetylase/succinyl-diaminopimelate desuccinylase-like protein
MRDRIADLLAELVAIDSVNPSLVPGGAGEGEIAAFVAAWAHDAGLQAQALEETPGRPSRTLPGESAAAVEGELVSLLDRCRAADPELQAAQRTLLVREPFEIAPDAEIVAVVRAAAAEALGAPPATGGASYWADAAFIAQAGIPTVMFGPGGEGAHAAEEWVSLSETESVARTLVAVAARVCA